MKKKQRTVLIISLILGLLLPMACAPKAQETATGSGSPSVTTTAMETLPNEKLGNSNGNISNGGFSVTDGDWIYFLKYEQYDTGSLYKMKKDGTEMSMISPDTPMSLNLLEGFIYYINAKTHRICRIKPDGTERTQLNDYSASHLIADGEFLYYIEYAESPSESGGVIHRIRLDGTERTKMGPTRATRLNLAGDMIYFVASDEKLYRVKSDGTGEQALGDQTVWNFTVAGDKIYYIDGKDNSLQIWSVGTDGTGAVRLTEDKALAINVSGDWIYYVRNEVGLAPVELKKMKLDGSAPAVVSTDKVTGLNIHDDLLAYFTMGFETFFGAQVFVRTDGTNRKEIAIPPMASGESETGYETYPMGEMVKTEEFSVQVRSVYGTNLWGSADPASDPERDRVAQSNYLFITFEVTNDSPVELELGQRLGTLLFSPEGEKTYLGTRYIGQYADITGRQEEVKESKYLPKSDYSPSLVVKPGETRTVQAVGQMEGDESETVLGLLDADQQPLAAIAIELEEVDHFLNLGEARDIADDFNVDQFELINIDPIRSTLDGQSQVFYPFMYEEEGKEAFLLVNRETGEVYRGERIDGKITPTEPVK